MSDSNPPIMAELEAEAEAMRALAKSRNRNIRLEIARSSACPSDVLARFVRSRDRDLIRAACRNRNLDLKDMRWAIRWRLLDGAANLVNNPSCPRQIADQLAHDFEQWLLLVASAPDQRSVATVARGIKNRVRTAIPDWQLHSWWGDPTTISIAAHRDAGEEGITMTCQIDADPLISCGNCGTLIRRIDAFATYDDDRPPWLCVSCKRVWCGEYVCSTCLREYGDHGPFLGCPDCGQ